MPLGSRWTRPRVQGGHRCSRCSPGSAPCRPPPLSLWASMASIDSPLCLVRFLDTPSRRPCIRFTPAPSIDSLDPPPSGRGDTHPSAFVFAWSTSSLDEGPRRCPSRSGGAPGHRCPSSPRRSSQGPRVEGGIDAPVVRAMPFSVRGLSGLPLRSFWASTPSVRGRVVRARSSSLGTSMPFGPRHRCPCRRRARRDRVEGREPGLVLARGFDPRLVGRSTPSRLGSPHCQLSRACCGWV